MRTGNMVLNRKPKESDFKEGTLFCSSCGKECVETAIDNSFGDSFGYVTDWAVGSYCCEAEAYKGTIYLDTVTTRTARKDHLNKKGEVIIKAGQKYRAYVKKGFYVDDKGKHHGHFEYRKVAI